MGQKSAPESGLTQSKEGALSHDVEVVFSLLRKVIKKKPHPTESFHVSWESSK